MNEQQISTCIRDNSVPQSRLILSGVYSVDEFLILDREDIANKICIINTHPRDKPGEHWFIIDNTSDETISIFDSYGIISPLTIDFRKKIEDKIKYLFPKNEYKHDLSTLSKPILQSLDTNVCGDYCIVYVLCRSLEWQKYQILQFMEARGVMVEKEDSHHRDHLMRRITSLLGVSISDIKGFGQHSTHILPVDDRAYK